MYLETAQRLKDQQPKRSEDATEERQLDFEFVLFASVMIDYDYIIAFDGQLHTGHPW